LHNIKLYRRNLYCYNVCIKRIYSKNKRFQIDYWFFRGIPAIPSNTFAAANAANAAAVAAANPCRNSATPSAPAVDVEAPVHYTLPANVAAFPAAYIMPTAALAPTAKFATSEAAAADVSVATVAAYSTLGVTIVNDAKMGDKTVKAVELGKKNHVVVQASAPAVASAVMPPVALAATANFDPADRSSSCYVSIATVTAYFTSTAAVLRL
jgi:hypothetical protein